MPSLSLIGGLILDGGEGRAVDVHLDGDGVIVGLGAAPKGFAAAASIDASGQWLIGNLTDISACLSFANQEMAESLSGELRALERCGIAQALMKPPLDHYVDHSDHVRELARVCVGHAVKVAPCASLYRQDSHGGARRFIDFHSMHAAGCREIDIPARTRYSPRDIEKAMILAESLDMRINLTPLDPDLAGTGCCHQGSLSAHLGLDGIGVTAETVSMLLHLEIAHSTGCRLHLSQLSSARAVEILARARQDNPRLSADVGITHLDYTVDDIAGYQGLLHTIPPVREESDRKALLDAVNKGVIDCVSSSHMPLTDSDKCNPFPGVRPGTSAIDSFVPQLLNLVHQGELAPQAAMAAIGANSHAVLHHGEAPPVWQCGASPTISLIDPKQEREWRVADLHSAGKNNPSVGRRLVGTMRPLAAAAAEALEGQG